MGSCLRHGTFGMVVRSAVEKILSVKQLEKAQNSDNVQKWAKTERATLFLEYRGVYSDGLMKKVRSITSRISVAFVTRKLESVMSNPKDSFPEELKSRVIYKLDCLGGHACYVGTTSGHLETRLAEHQRNNAPVKQHLSECNVEEFQSILASCFMLTKLAILEALFIEKLKPSNNSKEEQTSRPLTVRL